MSQTIHFKVQGQEGDLPQVALGTSQLLGEVCVNAVVTAVKVGYRGIDTALLYGNQTEIGVALKKIEVPREQIWVTSKVGFFPPGLDIDHDPLKIYKENNIKGNELDSIDLCLKQLDLDFVDLLLIHNPVTSVEEYAAAVRPHFFEFFNSSGRANALPIEERKRITEEMRAEVLLKNDAKLARQIRETSWKNLEQALREKKCRYIGVSNYSVELIEEMKEYATIMPAVNQLEIQPKFSSPQLRKLCGELGIALTAYGSGTFVSVIEKYDIPKYNILREMSERIGKTPNQIVLRWTTQSGLSIIPRSKSEIHLTENLNASSFDLSPEDMKLLDGMNADYPNYWDPVASAQTI